MDYNDEISKERLAKEHAEKIFEERARAFRVLYDTVMEVEGASQRDIYLILCRNLRRICNAHLAAIASYDVSLNSLRLEFIDKEGQKLDLSSKKAVDKTMQLSKDLLENLKKEWLRKCEDIEKCFLDFSPYIITDEFKPDKGIKFYRFSCVREGELIALGVVQLEKEQKLRMKDIIEIYLNMSGMILQRVMAGKALRESEEEYRVLIQTIPDIIYELDSQGNFTFISEGIRNLGYETDKLIGQHISEIIHPDDLNNVYRPVVLKNFEGKITGDDDAPKLFDERRTGQRMTKNLEVRILLKTPQRELTDYCYAEVNSSGKWSLEIQQDNKDFLGSIGILRDITERKLTEQELNRYRLHLEDQVSERTIELTRAIEQLKIEVSEREKAQAELKKAYNANRDIIENAPFGIYLVNTEGNIDYVNPAMLKISGDSAEQFKSLNVFTLPTYTQHDLSQRIREVLEGKYFKLENVEYKSHFSKKDSIRNFIGIPLEEEGKKKALMIVEDITEREKAEKQLEGSIKKLERVMQETVAALASVVEKRDPYTSGHQQRVAELACAIAKELNLPQEVIKGIHVAAIIHDIGKINIPAEILNKPGKLTEMEFGLIKSHPQVGYDILKTIEFQWPVAQIVLQHHERMNGSGYPNGLTADNILLEAKIICVSDVVEAMVSHRPYRPALGYESAFDELSKNKGVLYDSQVVDVCLRLFKEEKFSL